MMLLCEETKIISTLMLSVALLLARPDEGKLQQNQVQIDNSEARGGNKLSQNRKWIGLLDFYEEIKLFWRCCKILILNPQVVKEIVTDIMIIISPYFFS